MNTMLRFYESPLCYFTHLNISKLYYAADCHVVGFNS